MSSSFIGYFVLGNIEKDVDVEICNLYASLIEIKRAFSLPSSKEAGGQMVKGKTNPLL